MFLWFTMSPVYKNDQLSKQTRRVMNSSSAKPLQNLSKLRTASSTTAERWWLFYTRKAESWQKFQATSESWISFDPSSCRQIRCSSLTSFLSNYIRILADHHGQWWLVPPSPQPSYKKQYLRSYGSIHAASSDLTWTSWLRAHPVTRTLILPFPAQMFPLHWSAISQCFSPAALIKSTWKKKRKYLFTGHRRCLTRLNINWRPLNWTQLETASSFWSESSRLLFCFSFFFLGVYTYMIWQDSSKIFMCTKELTGRQRKKNTIKESWELADIRSSAQIFSVIFHRGTECQEK